MLRTIIVLILLLVTTAPQQGAIACQQQDVHQCLSNHECAPNLRCERSRISFVDGECGTEDCDSRPYQCGPRLEELKDCNIGLDDCRSDLYCAFDVPKQASLPVCAPKKKLGEACAPTDTLPCANVNEVRCNPATNECEIWNGRLNDTCRFSRDCRRDEGFFCDETTEKCKPRKPDGAKCRRFKSECVGFCARKVTPRSEIDECATIVKEGGVCRDDDNCDGFESDLPNRNIVRCNTLWNGPGYCVRQRDILIEPGAVCDPNSDRCDRGRNLFCQRQGDDYRCTQNSTEGEYCTPGSKYSMCNEREAGVPLECRRPLSFTKKQPFDVAICLRPPEIVKRGQICNRQEFSRCERGTECRSVAGIEHFDGEDKMARLGYCVKIVKAGKRCKNRFKTGCAEGSYCIKGKCRKRDKAPTVPVKYAGDYVGCNDGKVKKRCARGLECDTRRGFARCLGKTAKVKSGKPCYSHPNKRRECVEGYACVRDLKRDGRKRCMKRGELHDFCGFGTCAEGLQCRPRWEDGPLTEVTCFNPKTALPAGSICNIVEKNGSHNCGVISVNLDERPLRCTEVPGKGGPRKCLLENKIFGYCNVTDNVVCAPGFTCSSQNLCVTAM